MNNIKKSKANNNPKNRRGLLEYQKRQRDLSRITELEAKQRIINSNLDRWEGDLPDELKNAKPNNLPQSLITRIKELSIKPPYEKYLLVTSENPMPARFTSYSILHSLLKNGVVTPSQVRVTSIMDGYNNISGMFQSRKWKEYFFHDNAKILLIEGSSKNLTLLASRGEDQFWKELIEFTMNNDKLVIISYSTNEEEREKKIFIPELTSIRELNARLIRKSTFIKINAEEEEVIKNGQKN